MSAYRTLGTDSSGRPIRMSPVFADWWGEYCDRLGFTPTITQGGWLTNAAAASATTHAGDALDMRVWDRTQSQVQAMVRVAREMAAAAWLRDVRHGGFSDPHVHLVPGRWAHPSPSALRQWDACRNGRNGLASNGADYHPYPLATTPPEDDMTPDDRKTLDEIQRTVNKLSDNQIVVANTRIKAILAYVSTLKDLPADVRKAVDDALVEGVVDVEVTVRDGK